MRILICSRPSGAFGYISDGWANACRDKGHVVSRWDGLEESWRSFDPDLYIGCSGHKQPIPHRRHAKVAIHVNPYGPVKIEGINESEENIRWTINQKPDVVFGYGSDNDRILWSYWTTRHNIKWVPLPTAGDSTIYKDSEMPEKKYDIVYLGGRWAYKAKTIDAYLLPLLEEHKNFKLHGWGEWPSGISSGELPPDKASEFLSSGKIGPCISEKHTHDYGIDIPERAFKVALSGTLVVHDATIAIRDYIPSALVATTPSQFKQLCKHYLHPSNISQLEAAIRKQRDEVVSAHTYHHRMSRLLKDLGFTKDSEEIIA